MAESDDPVIVGGWSMSAYRRLSPWKRFTAALPMRTALTGVGLVWLLGCVWSFEEQTNFAAAKGFTLPWLLPLVIDGLAAAMAGVAYAASLDARPAIPARIATALAVAASATSNGVWASERAGADIATIALAVGIPVAANVAFEVLLSEMRRQIQRRRGQRPPVAIPYPRFVRIVLSPFKTFFAWRRLVLEITDPRHEIEPVVPPAAEPAAAEPAAAEPAAAEPAAVVAPSAAQVPARPEPDDSTDPPTTRLPRVRPEPAQPARAEVDRASRPRRPAAVATAAASNNGGNGSSGANGFDGRVQQVAELIRGGEDLTGDAVGEMFGCSARTGRRLLAQGVELATRRNGDHAPAPDPEPAPSHEGNGRALVADEDRASRDAESDQREEQQERADRDDPQPARADAPQPFSVISGSNS